MDYYRKKKSKIKYMVIAFVAIVLIILAGVYAFFVNYYGKHFFPDSWINGEDVSNMYMDESVKTIGSSNDEYVLKITTRDGQLLSLNGDLFDYTYTTDATPEKFLNEQNKYMWFANLSGRHEYTINVSASYSEDKLEDAAKQLKCFDEDLINKPENAYITKEDGKIQIVEETMGNELLEDKCIEAIKKAVSEGKNSLEFDDDFYVKPEVTSDSEELTNCMEEVNKYMSSTITYDIGDNDEVLDKDKINDWIDVDDKLNITFDKDKIAQYVQSLASKYNTYGDKREFKTSKGDVIEIGGGDYGWVIDKEAEAKQIFEDISTGKDIKREPVYSQVAKVPGAKDIGDTYIELDYTNQHLYYYKEGKLVTESDFVSGNLSRGNGSPDGVYKIIYKQSPAVLKGEGYQSHVSYFMVFAYNVGIHDASWRDKFGGQIYKSSGSHGCINVPPKFAKELYSILETDTPVVAYYREKVTLTAENAKISNAFSYKK